MTEIERLGTLLGRLTGQPVSSTLPLEIPDPLGENSGALGYSQLNELLLLFGLDRITHAFFTYLLHGTTEYTPGDGFTSFDELEVGVERFRKAALLLYGNVRFAFKSLSRDADLLVDELERLAPLDPVQFEMRHDPILPLATIPPEDAYLTGYLIERELQKRLDTNPKDREAASIETRRREVVQRAIENQRAYLASDHLDVYVATSMRARHEFLSIARLVRRIFDHDDVRPLKLRWFDPTQAYCSNRIDKGLAEALMLKRATCTIYLAQESDTLGKDSELASTLAQGKPVIAYVPKVDDDYLSDYFASLSAADPGDDDTTTLLGQLRLFDPDAAWTDPAVREWLADTQSLDPELLRSTVRSCIEAHYDRRAQTLKESHPLAIQVNLSTGVANGVLVVRTPEDCARLVRAIVTRRLEFDLEELPEYTVLRERISGSIFRVMTADAMLTNTFWNYYLDPAE